MQAGHKHPDEMYYFICAKWIKAWSKWSGKDSHTDAPGTIDNSTLLAGGGPNPQLKAGKHFKGINGRAWHALISIYGGGPAITSPDLNMKKATVMVRLAASAMRLVCAVWTLFRTRLNSFEDMCADVGLMV